MNKKFFANPLIQRIIWLMLIALLWETIAISGLVSELIFPRIEDIFKALLASLLSGELITHTAISLIVIFKGLIIGAIAALILSLLSILSKTFENFIEMITTFAHPLPGLALLPLVILWFGTGTASIIAIIVHSVLWPLILNTLAGFKSTPRIYRELGQNFGLSNFKITLDIMLPSSSPYILSGLKIAWARSWRALISAEMVFGAIGGKGGLGWYIFKQRVFMDTAGIFAGLIIIIVIGIIVEDLIFKRLEAVTLKKWGMTL